MNLSFSCLCTCMNKFIYLFYRYVELIEKASGNTNIFYFIFIKLCVDIYNSLTLQFLLFYGIVLICMFADKGVPKRVHSIIDTSNDAILAQTLQNNGVVVEKTRAGRQVKRELYNFRSKNQFVR